MDTMTHNEPDVNPDYQKIRAFLVKMLNGGLEAVRVLKHDKNPGWNGWQSPDPNGLNTVGLPLADKIERVIGWLEDGYNFGLTPRGTPTSSAYVVYDIDLAADDPRRKALAEQVPALAQTLQVVNEHDGKSHHYFSIQPADEPILPSGFTKADIQIYGRNPGLQIVGPGSRVLYGEDKPPTGVYGRIIMEAGILPLPDDLNAALASSSAEKGEKKKKERTKKEQSFRKKSLADLEAILEDLPAENTELYGDWMNVILAVHGSYKSEIFRQEITEPEVISTLTEWSERSPKCKEGEVAKKWNSIKDDKSVENTLSWGSLEKWAGRAERAKKRANTQGATASKDAGKELDKLEKWELYLRLDLEGRPPTSETMAARLLVDHPNDMVLVTDGRDDGTIIYYVQEETGLLTDVDEFARKLLSETVRKAQLWLMDRFFDSGNKETELRTRSEDLRRFTYSKVFREIRNQAALAYHTLLEYGCPQDKLPKRVHPSDTDKRGNLVGCANGVLNMFTGEILSAKQAKVELITRQTGTEWREGSRHDAVDKVFPSLKQIAAMPEGAQKQNAADIAACYGWALGHNLSDDLMVEVGKTATGKTTRQVFLRAALGDYVGTIDALMLVKSAFAGGEVINSGLEPLTRARIVYVPEAKNMKMNTALLNDLTSEPTFKLRKCRENARTVPIRAHLVIQGNPDENTAIGFAGTGEVAKALRRRARCLTQVQHSPPNTDGQIEGDVTLKDRAYATVVKRALLCRMQEYAAAVADEQKMPQSKDMNDYMRELSDNEEKDWVKSILVPILGEIELSDHDLDTDEKRFHSKGRTRARLIPGVADSRLHENPRG